MTFEKLDFDIFAYFQLFDLRKIEFYSFFLFFILYYRSPLFLAPAFLMPLTQTVKKLRLAAGRWQY
jgi:hypothetical protein